MNVSQNRRYQETEERIRGAFWALIQEKPIDAVLIQELCQKAGISRSSFYTHYEDVNDLILKIEREKTDSIMGLLAGEKLPTAASFTAYFQYLSDNRNFYLAFFQTQDSAMFAVEKIDALIKKYPAMANYHGYSLRELRYHMTFFMAGLKAIAYQWLRDGCAETPEKMSQLISDEYGAANRPI